MIYNPPKMDGFDFIKRKQKWGRKRMDMKKGLFHNTPLSF